MPACNDFLKLKHCTHISTDLPKSVSASLSPFGEIVEGSSVTLTCSSDANPPVHNYTWHFSTTTLSMVKGTGESLSFNMTPVYSGLYHCEARNEIGSQNSNQVSVFFEGQYGVISSAIHTFSLCFFV